MIDEFLSVLVTGIFNGPYCAIPLCDRMRRDFDVNGCTPPPDMLEPFVMVGWGVVWCGGVGWGGV